MIEIKPQPGFQNQFLSSAADIVIGGGAAGAGKTFALLLEPLRHINNSGFGAVIFRRTSPQIRSEGGLWDTSKDLYPLINGLPKESSLEWTFPSGAKIKFSHLEYEKNIYDWQGSQIALIAFDELTHFSENMFFYLLSRNRSVCGIKPYLRATCNPDPDSWVAKFISWWVDQDSGFPIQERAGRLRYFIRDSGSIIWGNSKQEIINGCPHLFENSFLDGIPVDPENLIKSVTFIPGDIYGNVELLKKDPAYLANLVSQDEVIKNQLLRGNWKVRIADSDLINYIKFKDTFSNEHVSTGPRYITADIALKGSDLLVIYVWEGFRLIDCKVLTKSKGNEVVESIKTLAVKWQIPNSSISYDDDGVGQFIDGFIVNSNAFKNNSRPFNDENYKNLKSQCYFKMADRINNSGYYISPDVSTKVINGKTIEQHLFQELRAIKQNRPDSDGRLSVIPKEQMKKILGHSPDFMDALMMREFFELNNMSKGLNVVELVAMLGF